MKKILLSALLSVWWLACSAQDNNSLLITYELDYKPSKTKTYRSKTFCSLYVTDEKTIFLDEKMPKIFALEKLSGAEKAGARVQIGIPAYSFILIKKQGQVEEIEEQLDGTYVGYSTTPAHLWQIHEDTLTVAGMLSNKATCAFKGRMWTAWYSSEIPLPEGPHKFGELPGLILKLASDDGDFNYQIQKIEKNKPRPPLPKYTITSKERFLEIRKLSHNSVRKMESQGGTLGEVKFNGKIYSRDEWVRHLDKEYEDKNRIE
jgi:GLPGLI family protein